MHVVIYGAGGAGGYFGARLARGGHDVTIIARGAHLKAIRDHGLILEAPEGEMVVRPALATDDPAEVAGADVVILGVKAWQVKEAAEAIKPMMGRDTFVVPLQNGVEAALELAEVLGSAHVVGGLCGTLSRIVAPGRIRSVGAMNFIRFGELDNRRSERVEGLRSAFQSAGVRVDVPADIERALWEKFLPVTAFGGVGAVTRAPIGVLRTIPETRAMLERCLDESEAVGRARGARLAETVVADTLRFLDSLTPDGTTSLQRDIVEGRRSELDYWNGAVVRLGKEAGVATPTHAFIYHSLLPQERRARGEFAFPG
jgi:2-dehydropantoate 2-reductase